MLSDERKRELADEVDGHWNCVETAGVRPRGNLSDLVLRAIDTAITEARADRVLFCMWCDWKIPDDGEPAEMLKACRAHEMECVQHPLRAQLVEARDLAERACEQHNALLADQRILRCAFCDAEYPPDTPPTQAEALTDHVKVCPAHPMREVEQRLAEAEDSARMCVCLWCGEALDAGGTPDELRADPALMAAALELFEAHDLACERNPLRAKLEQLLTDRETWAALSNEQSDRIGKALDGVREKRASGEPSRDDATEVEALVRRLRVAVARVERARRKIIATLSDERNCRYAEDALSACRHGLADILATLAGDPVPDAATGQGDAVDA